MQFNLTVRFPNGNGGGVESHDLPSMQEELKRIALVLSAMVPGETIEIKRMS